MREFILLKYVQKYVSSSSCLNSFALCLRRAAIQFNSFEFGSTSQSSVHRECVLHLHTAHAELANYRTVELANWRTVEMANRRTGEPSNWRTLRFGAFGSILRVLSSGCSSSSWKHSRLLRVACSGCESLRTTTMPITRSRQHTQMVSD